MHRLIFASIAVAAMGLAREVEADSAVVFNEVQYHPPGNEADLEWLELHSQMAVDMDISGWSLNDGVFFEFPGGTIVPGWGHLVVAASPSALEAAGFAGALGPFEGRLDNSGETLTLVDRNGRIMDSVRYRDGGSGTGSGDAWPVEPDGSGATLAKRDPDAASGPSANWVCSAQVGGTPGRENFPLPEAPGSLPRDVISYWSLDQSGGQMLDVAGGNNGAVGSGVTRVPGIVGSGAASFDNTSNAFINVGAGKGNNFSVTSGITVEAVVQPGWSAAIGDHDEIFRKEDGNNRILFSFQHDGNTNGLSHPPVGPGPVLSFGLNVGGSYTELDMVLDGQAGRPALAELTDGAPHHVAATYDAASGLKAIYVDGRLAFSVQLTQGSQVTSGGATTAYIGNTSGRAEPFTGTIDEVAVWDRALSAAEVAKHFDQATAGKSYFDTEPVPNVDQLPRLAFNEVFSSAVDGFWLELVNLEAGSVQLQGHIIARALPASGEYVFPALLLPAGGQAQVTRAQLGFEPQPGEAVFLYAPDRLAVIAAARVEGGLRGRHPDGTGPWLFPDAATPGAPNRLSLRSEVVINEIMYHHRLAANGAESPESWIELYNRGAAAVDLSGWRIDGGIEHAFEPGTVLAPGAYLVVASDRAYLQSLYPGIAIAGDFTRRLSGKSDRIVLLDERGNPADEVRYHDGGRWPGDADGGGSSLELRDPRADNSGAEAWTASDESPKAAWRNYSYRMNAAANVGPARWNELLMGLLDAGEALVDDIHVIETPATTPREFLQNGTFDTGAAKWRLLGNHSHSEVVSDPGAPGNNVLRLVATGPTEHMHNHAETTYGGGAAVSNGREYEVSFRARWLAGSNQLNTRLYFNRAPKTTLLDVPALNGTPGARNSTFVANIGPTYSGFGHRPIAPRSSDAVTVSVRADDPDGVSGVVLRYSVNGGAWQSAAMTAKGGGLHEGNAPPQASASLVQFYVEGTDSRGVTSTFPAKGPDSRALYRVEDGLAILGRVHNVRILMTAADTSLLHLETNVMSNDRLGSTIVYDEREAFYDAGTRLKGSERGRFVDGRVGFNIKLPPDHLFRGVHEAIQVDRSGGWSFGGPSGQDEILIKHMANHAGDIPSMYDDIIRVIAPRNVQNGPALLIMAAYGDVYLDSQFPNGSDGTAYELELIYYPTTTTGGVEGLKRPQPDEVLGTDLRDLGNDKEVYRWTFLIENNRARDDYAPLIALCKAFGLPASTLDAGTRAVMDVDNWMRAFALTSLCGVVDAYTRGNNHNLVMYQRPEDGKLMALPWDSDFSFTNPTNASLWGDQNLSRIIQLTPNRRLYYCHLLDIIETTFNAGYMSSWASHYGALAEETYTSLVTYITQRRAYVLQTIPARVEFAITTNGGQDFVLEAPSAMIEGNAWFDVKSILIEGRPDLLELTWPTFTRWRATVPLAGGVNGLRFVALDRHDRPMASDTITITNGASVPVFIRGDVDLDRSVDIADVIKLLYYLYLGSSIGCEDAADVTNNGVHDVADAVYALNYLYRSGAPPKAPFPDPGEDTGAGDVLGCERGVLVGL